MADGNKDLVARLTDLSEGAIQRLSEAPGADRALQALKGLGDLPQDFSIDRLFLPGVTRVGD